MNNNNSDKNLFLAAGLVGLFLVVVVSYNFSGGSLLGSAIRGSDKSGTSVPLGNAKQVDVGSKPAPIPLGTYCPDVTGADVCVLDLTWKTAPTLDASTYGNAPISAAASSLIQNVIYFRMNIANNGTVNTEIPVGTVFHLYVDAPISPNLVATWQPGFVDGVYQGDCSLPLPMDNCAPYGAPSKYNYNYKVSSLVLVPYSLGGGKQTIDFVSSRPTSPVISDVNGQVNYMTPAQFVSTFGVGAHQFILQADEIQTSDNCSFILPSTWFATRGCISEGIYTATGLAQEPTNNFYQIPFTII